MKVNKNKRRYDFHLTVFGGDIERDSIRALMQERGHHQ